MAMPPEELCHCCSVCWGTITGGGCWSGLVLPTFPTHPQMRGSLQASGKPCPGELVLVVVEVQQPRARKGGEAARGLVVRGTLELERADEATAGTGVEPALDQPKKPRRVAHHVREQPIDRPERAGIESEGALLPHLDAGHGGDGGVERRRDNADHPRTQPRP